MYFNLLFFLCLKNLPTHFKIIITNSLLCGLWSFLNLGCLFKKKIYKIINAITWENINVRQKLTHYEFLNLALYFQLLTIHSFSISLSIQVLKGNSIYLLYGWQKYLLYLILV